VATVLGLLGLATLVARPDHSWADPAVPLGSPEDALPNVLLLTIDTLRSDRLSAYGYHRPTSPHLDRLLAGGARLTQARTVEPLTNPALTSLITARYPHEHGGTRNGLRMRPGLDSLPKLLSRRGYQTAAFVANWTLRDRISGLGEHFGTYEEVLTKRRWFGLFKGEADAADVTDAALAWLADYGGRRRPFLLWVHYVDPHAPYQLHKEFAPRLGLGGRGSLSKSDRYDTEVAFVDHHVGRLLAAIEDQPRLARRTLVVFTADHGESLGEHGYWGHGRNLHEPGLRIPMGFTWADRIRPQVIDSPALILDVAPTVLSLLGLPPEEGFRGHDWGGVFAGGAAPAERVTWFQAHRGAVVTAEEAKNPRLGGLLEVGLLKAGMKEILDIGDLRVRLFDLHRDPAEARNLKDGEREPSDQLEEWRETVVAGLTRTGSFPPPALDPESLEQLRALGYAN
jgi:arylsulfatase A-like enzyme